MMRYICLIILIFLIFKLTEKKKHTVDSFEDKNIITSLTKFDRFSYGGKNKASNFLIKKIKTIPNIHELDWAPGFTQNVINGKNIIFGIKNKNTGGRRNILILAHYDTIGPNFPGGNDNASGVYALLLIAKKISQSPVNNVIFAITDNEEIDFVFPHASKARNENFYWFVFIIKYYL